MRELDEAVRREASGCCHGHQVLGTATEKQERQAHDLLDESRVLVAATIDDQHDKRLENVGARDDVDGTMVLEVPKRIACVLEGGGRVKFQAAHRGPHARAAPNLLRRVKAEEAAATLRVLALALAHGDDSRLGMQTILSDLGRSRGSRQSRAISGDLGDLGRPRAT